MMRSLLSFFSFLFILNASATHIVGGEVYYDSLGNNQYKITFEVYRDCTPGTSGYDDPLHYTVFLSNGTIYGEYFINLSPPDTLPLVYDDPCVTPPDDVCIEKAVYIDTITLPTTVTGYYITYQRCCWSNAIINIQTPGDWGLTITTTIPGTNLVSERNNCARFLEYPPIALCSNNTLVFDHSALDPDGDSLVYSICTPLTININNPGGAEPSPDNAQPYANIPWDTGFSNAQPFGAGATATIDSQTGIMSITPNLIGTYVMAVCVEEWRNGILINTKSRTFGYNVLICEEDIPVQVQVFGNLQVIEDCGSAGFVVSRSDSSDALVVQLLVSGTATPGTDYNALPSSVTLPVNVGSDTIVITPFLDGFLEGSETVELSAIIFIPCENSYDTVSTSITILDYINLNLSYVDSLNVCDEEQTNAVLTSLVVNGVPPYIYFWDPWPVNNDTLVVPTVQLQPNLNNVTLSVFDVCGKEVSGAIKVYNQCPLVLPNVITPNDDDINEFLIIKNIEDYDRVHVVILNRWGNVVWENEDYNNEWKGNNNNGDPLSEGVYTYIATPMSDKYQYNEAEKALYTAHGFVHIIKN